MANRMQQKKMQILLPENFKWKLFMKIVDNKEQVIDEKTAKEYFRNYATHGSELNRKYHRASNNIPELFKEDVYINFLKLHHGVKMVDGEINDEKLYIFYDKIGKKKYPLTKIYYKLAEIIPDNFDEVLYEKIYFYKDDVFKVELKERNIFEIYYFMKDKYPLSNEYYKLLYGLPEYFDITDFKERYKSYIDLNDDDKEIFEMYNKKKTILKLDSEYFKIYFKFPCNFDEDTYLKRYDILNEKIKGLSLYEKYKLYKNYMVNNILDDKYNRIKFNIDDNVNIIEYQKLTKSIDINTDKIYKNIDEKNKSKTKEESSKNINNEKDIIKIQNLYKNCVLKNSDNNKCLFADNLTQINVNKDNVILLKLLHDMNIININIIDLIYSNKDLYKKMINYNSILKITDNEILQKYVEGYNNFLGEISHPLIKTRKDNFFPYYIKLRENDEKINISSILNKHNICKENYFINDVGYLFNLIMKKKNITFDKEIFISIVSDYEDESEKELNLILSNLLNIFSCNKDRIIVITFYTKKNAKYQNVLNKLDCLCVHYESYSNKTNIDIDKPFFTTDQVVLDKTLLDNKKNFEIFSKSSFLNKLGKTKY